MAARPQESIWWVFLVKLSERELSVSVPADGGCAKVGQAIGQQSGLGHVDWMERLDLCALHTRSGPYLIM
jgi:hypothetical protein